MTGFAALFAVAVAALFIWGVWMGVVGLIAEHPPFREGGHAPGAEGTYDPLYMETLEKEVRKAA